MAGDCASTSRRAAEFEVLPGQTVRLVVMRRSLTLVGAVCVWVVATTVLAPSAQADTVWQSGIKVGTPSLMQGNDWVGPVHSFPASGRPCGSNSVESTAVVKTTGDYVFVKDTCADGRSAIARITGNEKGHWHTRYCRNAHGIGSWARCKFEWPEAPQKHLAAGVYNGSTGYLHVFNGNAVIFTK